MMRWLLGIKSNEHSSGTSTLRLLYTIIVHEGDLMERGLIKYVIICSVIVVSIIACAAISQCHVHGHRHTHVLSFRCLYVQILLILHLCCTSGVTLCCSCGACDVTTSWCSVVLCCSKAEMARLRLCAGCCMLKLAQEHVYESCMNLEWFQALALLIVVSPVDELTT